MKRIFLLLFILLLATAASSQIKVFSDSQGNLYQIWIEEKELKLSKSADQGLSFTTPAIIYTFTQEVASFDLKIDENFSCHLIYETKDKEIYYTNLILGQKSLKESTKLSKDSSSPVIAQLEDQIFAAWERKGDEDKVIYFSYSKNGGLIWSEPKVIQITGEVLSSPVLVIDNYQQTHLLFSAKNLKNSMNRIYYTSLIPAPDPIPNPKLLYESLQDLKSLQLKTNPWGIFAFWQKEILDKKELYLLASLDFGKTFSKEKIIPLDKDFLDLDYLNNKWTLYYWNKGIAARELKIDPPLAPALIQPSDKTYLNTQSPTFEFTAQAGEVLLYKIELSQDKSFSLDKTWSLDLLNSSASAEIKYKTPISLSDGTYYVRIFSFDGINFSKSSNIIEFNIDTAAPLITISSTIENEVKEEEIYIEGNINEPKAKFSLNGQVLTSEANGKFKTNLKLNSGRNILTFLATDEASNTAFLTKEVSYIPEDLKITISKPKSTDWFKAGSTAFIEAEISDFKEVLEDEAEAQVSISDNILETLVYDKNERKLSGFVTLSEKLAEGSNLVKIKLLDKEKIFTLNIDNQPPNITSNLCYTNIPSAIKLPISDAGAGIDSSATIIKIGNATFEGEASAESQGIILKPKTSFKDGTYEVEVTARDLVGNLGEINSFTLIVDTQPPSLLLNSLEAQTKNEKILLKGEVEDAYPQGIKIYVNQKLTEDFPLTGKAFTKEIKLFSGNNEILVEAYDAAGNKSSQSLQIFSIAAASNSLISSFANGPNPFNPKIEETRILFNLSQASQVKIYIFDLVGTLIKEIKNATSPTLWDGKDNFGNMVSNGVYPYMIVATSGGTTEIKRGKIIILK